MSEHVLISLLAQAEPWFNPALAGPVLGGGVGLLGGIYGCLVGVLAPQGKARGAVMAMHWGALALGAVFLVAGIVAVASDQPAQPR